MMAKYMIVALSTVVWMTLLVRLDPHRGQKGSNRRMILLFVLGMLSVVPAFILTFVVPAGDPTKGPLGASFMLFAFVYAPIEELSKFLVFFILVTRLRSLREPADGIFQAAAVGLGFAIVENVIYALSCPVPGVRWCARESRPCVT